MEDCARKLSILVAEEHAQIRSSPIQTSCPGLYMRSLYILGTVKRKKKKTASILTCTLGMGRNGEVW